MDERLVPFIKPDYRPHCKSSLTLSLSDWRIFLSFLGVLCQFLNSWRVSFVRLNVTALYLVLRNSNETQGKLKMNFHSLSGNMSELLEYGRMIVLIQITQIF